MPTALPTQLRKGSLPLIFFLSKIGIPLTYLTILLNVLCSSEQVKNLFVRNLFTMGFKEQNKALDYFCELFC